MRQIKHWLMGLTLAIGVAGAAVLPAAAQTAPPSPNPGEMVLGRADAPVTVIEYASLTCPHCAHFHETVWPELKKRYVDTGKVKFIYRDFPLDEAAMRGAQLARCKGDTDSFFAFSDILFSQQRAWATQAWAENLAQIARLGGIGSDQFRACMNDKALSDSILKSRLDGTAKYNVSGTPTLIVNEKNVGSPTTIEEMSRAIDAVLPRDSTGAAPATATPATASTPAAPKDWWSRVKSWFGS